MTLVTGWLPLWALPLLFAAAAAGGAFSWRRNASIWASGSALSASGANSIFRFFNCRPTNASTALPVQFGCCFLGVFSTRYRKRGEASIPATVAFMACEKEDDFRYSSPKKRR